MTDAFPPPQIPVQSTTEPSGSWFTRKFWKLPVWAWGIVLVVALGIAGAAGAGKKNDEPRTTPVDTTAVSVPSAETTLAPETSAVDSTVATTVAPATTQKPATTTAPPTTPAPTTPPTLPGFDEGTLLVGSDIQPGIYITAVPDDSFGCYWERLKDVSGEFDAIIANDNISPGGQVIVEIKASDGAFNSERCGRWVVYFPPAATATTFGEGVWVVGQQIEPGRYRSTGPGPDDFGCYWERKSGLSGEFGDIIANDNQSGPTVVDIKSGDVAFKSNGCGTWSKA